MLMKYEHSYNGNYFSEIFLIIYFNSFEINLWKSLQRKFSLDFFPTQTNQYISQCNVNLSMEPESCINISSNRHHITDDITQFNSTQNRIQLFIRLETRICLNGIFYVALRKTHGETFSFFYCNYVHRLRARGIHQETTLLYVYIYVG